MDIIKTLTGLINDVDNNDIDSLKDLYLELIHLRSELQDINYTRCCTELPIKKEINFDGNLLAEIETTDKNLKVLRCMDGGGNIINAAKVQIYEVIR